jgi:hypothetical protein
MVSGGLTSGILRQASLNLDHPGSWPGDWPVGLGLDPKSMGVDLLMEFMG